MERVERRWGVRAWLSFIGLFIISHALAAPRLFTVLNKAEYQHTVAYSQQRVTDLLSDANDLHGNQRVAFLVTQLLDQPYLYEHAEGEGDWQPQSYTYQPHAVHINQNPVYRLDGFNCQTFVQVIMAMLQAHSLAAFEERYIKIAYDTRAEYALDYFTRNHFTDADFNRVNQYNHLLLDVTATLPLKNKAKIAVSMLNRKQWLSVQKNHPSQTVQVLSAQDGMEMVARFNQFYQLSLPWLKPEKIVLSYLPKEDFLIYKQGAWILNETLMHNIPTPAVIEIVSDPKQWYFGKHLISQVIGTELNVSHMGLLYQQTFGYGQMIYQQINCDRQRICHVKPILCLKNTCKEWIFAHATDAYPDGYYWYQHHGQFFCSKTLPVHQTIYTQCNRVERIPLLAYLITQQQGSSVISNRSILGLHIEKILTKE